VSRTVWLAWSLIAASLLAGCGADGNVPNVPPGRFVAVVRGAVTDSLQGRAMYRMEDGRLTGVELAVDSATGLSVDVEPQARPRGLYQVVDWDLLGIDRGEAPPGVAVFLEVPAARFHAVAGTLDVSYVSAGEIGGTFDVQMEGTYDGVATDDPFVSVTGSFRAEEE
jgi:hypothetical protein